MRTPPTVVPRHRSIFAVDIEGSTTRTNAGRAVLRSVMYDLLEEALAFSGITEPHRELVDRGDGVLVLVRPVDDLPKTKLLDTVIPTLGDLLTKLEPEFAFRLRAAMHAGEVHCDSRGWYGEDLDITCRLLDAPSLKRKLKETEASLILVVSEDIYRSVIRHGYEGIDYSTFEPIVHIRIAGQKHRGWVQVPTQLTA